MRGKGFGPVDDFKEATKTKEKKFDEIFFLNS